MKIEDFDQVLKNLFSGVTCLFVDGYEGAIAIDCRTYPARSVEEPDKDKSLRGSRDGFVETVVSNTAMIRRRIRSEHLVMEMQEVGDSSRTDIAICYMKDRVNKEILCDLRQKVLSIRTDDPRMNQQSLAECLMKRKWYNPFPKFKFTERPDTAAACLFEGKVVLLVDNSPSAMILPTSILDVIEEANDYYFPTLTRVYLKSARGLISFLTIFLTPVFLLLMQNLNWLPKMFAFVAVKVENWNHDLSPWNAPAVFGTEDFGDGAENTLEEVLQLCTDNDRKYCIGGYSMAGLFALWAAMQTDRFKGVAATSPSVWFPGFLEDMKSRRVGSDCIYLSLGDKEEKTRNPVMAQVGNCIRETFTWLKEEGIPCTLEWNHGGHFKEPDMRTARAFAWVLEELAKKD